MNIQGGRVGTGASFSGNETNHFWLNLGGEQFKKLNGPAGAAAHSGDSRTFALFDYDHDGYQDFVMVNANAPYVQLFRNRMGDLIPEGARAEPIRMRFRGGNRAAQPATTSNRDGYGAKVRLQSGELSLLREFRCGEGLGAQNSATLLLGIGDAAQADRIVVDWPSGASTEIEAVPAGSLVTVFEDPAETADGSGVLIERFGERVMLPSAVAGSRPPLAADSGLLIDLAEGRTTAPYRLYTTWFVGCSACKRAAPTVAALRSSFSVEELAIFGFNVETRDDRGDMLKYQDKYRPAYDMLSDRTRKQVDAMKELLDAVLAPLKTRDGETKASAATPVTLLADAAGNVLWASFGVPTVSELRAVLHDLPGAGNH